MARDNRIDKYSEGTKQESISQEIADNKKIAEQVLATQISDSWEKKQRKPRMEDTHMRTSFLFRRDLKARLDVLSDYHGRGYRTQFLNKAIEFALDSAEAELKSK